MISLRHKLWLGYGGLLVILLAVSILTFIVLTGYSQALERVFRENYDSAVYCDKMKDALDQLNLRAQFLIWEEQAAKQIDPAAQEARFEENLALELANCTLPGELERTQHLSQLWKEYKTQSERLGSLTAEERRQIYQSDILPRHQKMKQAAQEISDMNMSNMVSVDGQVKRNLLAVRRTLLILVIAGTLAAAVVVGAAGTSILHPLRSLTRSARQIEGGDLDLSLPVRSHDEMGELAEAFNSMAARLREFRRIDHDRLQRTQQTTQLAIDSLPDAVFVIGPGGAVEISNRSARDLFGIEPGLTVGQLDARIKWLQPLYDSVKDGQRPEPPRGYHSALQAFDAGEERYLLPRAVPMFGQDKTPIGVTMILVDVTRLRIADEAKSNVVSTVSHELRTPLTSIRMALTLLSGEHFGAMSPKQITLLKAAREDTDRLNRIIENLMNMSRIESGRAEFELRPTPVVAIVSQAVDPMRSAFAEKRIALEVDLQEELPEVLADPAAIGSALSNLLSNALKFTPTGGRVNVRAEADGDFVAFSVADTGPGIPEQYVGRIFDKFFRVPRKEGPTGAGLGLAIAREVVVAHGGTIELRQNSAAGSAFAFTLRRNR